ncbi:MAG: bifunctional nicotinamidase/pyrazinamidase [Synoicihabitans sp.]
MKNALVLVDIQNDFLPGGALAVSDGNEVIPVVNKIVSRFDLVVATQDWHPADHGSFAENHADGSVGSVVDLNGLPQILWPTHCVANSRGADFASTLNIKAVDRVFPKGIDAEVDSYSGFFDNGKRRGTGLAEFLKEAKVSQIYITGLATDYCVKATALEACDLGFETYLVEDACRGVDLNPGDISRAIEEMREAGVFIISCAELPIGGNCHA